MAYENFKPVMWMKAIQEILRQETMFVDFCNQNIDGTPSYGNQVKILTAGKPTIKKYEPQKGPIEGPQELDGIDVTLNIDQARYFNFKVDDVDRAQTNPELMNALSRESALEMAAARDMYIAELMLGATNVSNSTAISTEKTINGLIDEALCALRTKNVTPGMEVEIMLPYYAYQTFKNKLVELKSNNDALIKTGDVGWYDRCIVKYSNLVHNDGTDDYGWIRTKKAVAFAGQLEKTEAYRPEGYFADALRGLDVYGAKIVRPDELYVLRMHK